ncbi:Flp family type IVb pilin [Alicyclobacillus sp. ALC3]|uniref:Flp family type IVb pilin n=1 Tax=Alicyclobacillus sp. ALC3 TaxID=2796143 RepID=UPI002379A2FF|nr:Flp family type IVb pilin [Alicyclobacillus sp. ALC3]
MKKFMWKSWFWMQSLKNREEGQGMVEYGLIIALIAVVVIGALIFLGGGIGKIFGNVANTVNNVA